MTTGIPLQISGRTLAGLKAQHHAKSGNGLDHLTGNTVAGEQRAALEYHLIIVIVADGLMVAKPDSANNVVLLINTAQQAQHEAPL